MSLATRCPNCSTTFRVVSDQLKLRHGLVKCGVCDLVFNGIEHLYYAGDDVSGQEAQAPRLAPIPTPAPMPITIPEARQLPPEPAHEEPLRALPDSRPPWPTLSPEFLPDPVWETASGPDSEAAGVQPPGVIVSNAPDETSASISARLGSPGDAPEARDADLKPGSHTDAHAGLEALRSAPLTAATLNATLGPKTLMLLDGDPIEGHELPEFLLDRPARPRWVTVSLVASLLFALALLAGQAIHAYRAELAQQWPRAAALVRSGCMVVLQTSEAECTAPLPQRASALRVSSAELQAGATIASDDARYTLLVTLHNDDALAQAWPALEVMLTNARNQQVLRRVIPPDEYLIAVHGAEAVEARTRQGIAAGADEALTIPIRVRIDEGIVGYAVGAFYP